MRSSPRRELPVRRDDRSGSAHVARDRPSRGDQPPRSPRRS
ncbi:hypothetical protein ACFPRL_08210 [Pseudoclavibacter helvolus]